MEIGVEGGLILRGHGFDCVEALALGDGGKGRTSFKGFRCRDECGGSLEILAESVAAHGETGHDGGEVFFVGLGFVETSDAENGGRAGGEFLFGLVGEVAGELVADEVGYGGGVERHGKDGFGERADGGEGEEGADGEHELRVGLGGGAVGFVFVGEGGDGDDVVACGFIGDPGKRGGMGVVEFHEAREEAVDDRFEVIADEREESGGIADVGVVGFSDGIIDGVLVFAVGDCEGAALVVAGCGAGEAISGLEAAANEEGVIKNLIEGNILATKVGAGEGAGLIRRGRDFGIGEGVGGCETGAHVIEKVIHCEAGFDVREFSLMGDHHFLESVFEKDHSGDVAELELDGADFWGVGFEAAAFHERGGMEEDVAGEGIGLGFAHGGVAFDVDVELGHIDFVGVGGFDEGFFPEGAEAGGGAGDGGFGHVGLDAEEAVGGEEGMEDICVFDGNGDGSGSGGGGRLGGSGGGGGVVAGINEVDGRGAVDLWEAGDGSGGDECGSAGDGFSGGVISAEDDVECGDFRKGNFGPDFDHDLFGDEDFLCVFGAGLAGGEARGGTGGGGGSFADE